MKTKLILIATLLTLIPQCTTNSAGKKVFDPVEAVTVINLTVPTAVQIGISKSPGSVKYLAAVAAAIDTFATGASLTPTDLENALDGVDTSILQTDSVRAIVNAAVTLYTTFYLKVVEQKLDQANLTVVLKALSADIKKGIN